MNETVETIFTAFTKLALFDGMPMLFVLRMKRVQKTHNFFEGAKKNIGNYTSIEIAAFVDGRGGFMHRGMWAFLIRLIIEEKEMKRAELATRDIRALAVKALLPKMENRDDDPKSLYSVHAARVRSWNSPAAGDEMGLEEVRGYLVPDVLARVPGTSGCHRGSRVSWAPYQGGAIGAAVAVMVVLSACPAAR